METLALPDAASKSTEPELNLLLARDPRGDWKRWRAAAVGSGIFHLIVIVTLLTVRSSPYEPEPERVLVRHVTPLFTPTELTQKAPNKTPLKKELTLETIAPRPILKAPAPAPAGKPAEPVKAPPPPQVAQAAPKPVVMEAPKIEAPVAAPPTPQIANAQAQPPPPGEAPPKITLEDVNPQRSPGGLRPSGAIQVPNPSVADAVRSLTRSAPQSGQSVGDMDIGGSGPGLNLPSSAGQPHAGLQLKSDPMGVDFRPYMTQVLAAIRRNWFAVYPEAARLGQSGTVTLEFAVVKQGLVTKVIFSGQSGAKALDQSAVAAISASNPLPPLPVEFKGDRIILQMTFLYNVKR
ncbi:MAG: TonB family protein [Bryobacteraceae bacterium]|jgi:TonB family protein